MKKEILLSYDYFKATSELTPLEFQLFEKAVAARANAYAPYSDFLVGCAILLENGEIISANNQENAAFPSGTCAERAAIFWAKSNYPFVAVSKIFIVGGPKDFPEKSVPTPPCGACRQSILEYETQQQKPIAVYFGSVSGEIFSTDSVKALLPFSFDAKYL